MTRISSKTHKHHQIMISFLVENCLVAAVTGREKAQKKRHSELTGNCADLCIENATVDRSDRSALKSSDAERTECPQRPRRELYLQSSLQFLFQ
jgi:hypothetical protein